MNCRSCTREIPAAAKFCPECGACSSASCAACGAELLEGSKFCAECGAAQSPVANPRVERETRTYTPKHLADKILTSRSALEGERKQVTVLFADVKSSMDLATSLDPEELHRVLDRFFQILADGVHRFEGTVNQYTGDGIMALFGAPIAHEDHAQRACYAALHLREELRRLSDELRRSEGLSFSTRMGLNSGEVVVGKIGDDLRMDYTAQGQVVWLAQRMESLAPPDRIYLSDATARLVSGLFELESLGEFALKGVAAPQPVHQLTGAARSRRRFDVARARGLTRFVGRDAEMATLEAALERARQGRGQVVGVVAEAGVGKSRLCFEFLERCRASGIAVLEGRAVSYGRNIPYLPMLELFRTWFGITEQDGEQSAREKIAGRLLLLDESFREMLPLLFEFLGVPDPERPAPRTDADTRQRQLFDVLRRLVREGGAGQPTVTLIEDLHWIDGSSDAFLAQWVEAIESSRGLLVVNLRPEYRAEWMARSCYHQIALAPLSAQAADELLDDLLGSDPSTRALAARIQQRTGGNPFFTEEVVQSLVESEQLVGTRGRYRLAAQVEMLDVPATVQAVLAARIDRLPEREKQVLQAASVIGREFSLPVLAQLVPFSSGELAAALAQLRSAELVFEQSLYPVEEYVFKHALTQEVAYGSQLRERRARAHAAAARAIEALSRDRLDESAALLAHHWEAAGDALQAARWHRRAAEWVNDSAASSDHWNAVRRLLGDEPQSAEELGLALAARIGILRTGWHLLAIKDSEAILREGVALAERAHDRGALVLLHAHYAVGASSRGYVRVKEVAGREASRIADEIGDRELQGLSRAGLINALVNQGRFDEAIEIGGQLGRIEPAELVGSESRYHCSFGLGQVAVALSYRGRFADAARELERARRLVREPDGEAVFFVHGNALECACTQGASDDALEHARRAVELAERIGGPKLRLMATTRWWLWACVVAARWHDAIRSFEELMPLERDARASLELYCALPYLAEAYLAIGAGAQALRAADDGLREARYSGARFWELPARIVRARALLLIGGATAADEAEWELSTAQALVDEMGVVTHAPRVLLARAELAQARGDAAACERERREAHRLFVAMGATGYAERLARELAS